MYANSTSLMSCPMIGQLLCSGKSYMVWNVLNQATLFYECTPRIWSLDCNLRFISQLVKHNQKIKLNSKFHNSRCSA